MHNDITIGLHTGTLIIQMSSMKKPILVFDLDGTLAHTAPDLLDSLNHCLSQIDLPDVNPKDLMRYVGHGGKVMIERALAARGRSIDAPSLDKMMATFLQHYVDHMPGKTAPYPGVLEAMARFTDAGYIHAICTNKYEGMSKTLLKGLALADRFEVICGQDTFAWKKPDPRHLLETITAAGGNRDHAVMIGDSVTDIDTAKAAGIPVVAVDFGYSDRPVVEYEPSHIISHFDELTLPLVERLIALAQG
jgi:phosphoglycolate phosphatase